MSTTTVNFGDLPPELLQTITLHQSLRDHIRFRSICRNFHSATPTPPREFPWLMLPTPTINQNQNLCCFFNPLTKILHRFTITESSPTRRCAGSSYGYLVMLDESPSIFLSNPLTRHKLQLPSLTDFSNVLKFDIYNVGREYMLFSPENDVYVSSLKEMRDCFIKKVIVSNNPKEGGFVAFAILNRFGELAYCKNGDFVWRVVDGMRSYSEDVICFNERFYSVNKFGSVAICDLSNENDGVSFINVEERIGGDMQYLVDAMGELLLVSRYLEFDIDIEHYIEVCRTVRFCVYRLDVRGRKWDRVMSLDDMVLFVGENSSFALLASDYVGCEGNRIYYTDDYSGANYEGIAGDQDVGVYDLVGGSTVALPCYPRNSHRPIWITPTLC